MHLIHTALLAKKSWCPRKTEIERIGTKVRNY